MQIDETPSAPVTPAPSGTAAGDKMDIEEEGVLEKKDEGATEQEKTAAKKAKAEKEIPGYWVDNLSRVLPQQLKYISFPEDGRYVPVKKVGAPSHTENIMHVLILLSLLEVFSYYMTVILTNQLN